MTTLLRTIFPSVLTFALFACSDPEPAEEDGATSDAAIPSPAPGTPAAEPQPTPLVRQLPGSDDKDPGTLAAYWAEAVEAGDRDAARLAWRQDVRMGGMVSRWANLKDIAVTFGEGRTEGAAGSSYHELPVTLHGRDPSGAAATLSGMMTLRRANGVAGADAEQLSWRIVSIDWAG